jgi:hypothetical protein
LVTPKKCWTIFDNSDAWLVLVELSSRAIPAIYRAGFNARERCLGAE